MEERFMNSAGRRLIVEEWDGSSVRTGTMEANFSFSNHRSIAHLHHFWRRFLLAFVPEGFPNSVTPDYVPFQVWDTLQGLSTYIRTMLSTQALLSAIGVGEKSATVMGATFQWFLRDLTGMIGGILFTLYQGSSLDSNAKTWRLAADIMNDLGMLMDLVSPLFPSAFVFVVCMGSLSRSFTGVASGATRAALTQHFALQNNAADISAKEGSQETVATITGMAIGMLLARLTMGHPLAIWLSFLALTAFHVFANYKAVRCLSLTSLNMERTSILVRHYIKTDLVLSPQQVATMEHVLPALTRVEHDELLHLRVSLGVRISNLHREELTELFHYAASVYSNEKYLLIERTGHIKTVLQRDASALDVLQAFVHALVMAHVKNDCKSLHVETKSWMNNHYQTFVQKCQLSGWKTSRLLTHSTSWRAHWHWQPSPDKID